jgi:hypothetical protein
MPDEIVLCLIRAEQGTRVGCADQATLQDPGPARAQAPVSVVGGEELIPGLHERQGVATR